MQHSTTGVEKYQWVKNLSQRMQKIFKHQRDKQMNIGDSNIVGIATFAKNVKS